MQDLSGPVERTPVNARAVRYDGYHRRDGLWDIEAEIVDTKAYALTTRDGVALQPGEDIHRMRVRITIDDRMVIHALEATTLSAPFPECRDAVAPMQRMVGLQIGQGWRRAIDTHLGAIRGCAHLRELLFNMGTAAFQTVPHYREVVLRAGAANGAPPGPIGGCLAWDSDGPVVARVAPDFRGWRREQAGARGIAASRDVQTGAPAGDALSEE